MYHVVWLPVIYYYALERGERSKWVAVFVWCSSKKQGSTSTLKTNEYVVGYELLGGSLLTSSDRPESSCPTTYFLSL